MGMIRHWTIKYTYLFYIFCRVIYVSSRYALTWFFRSDCLSSAFLTHLQFQETHMPSNHVKVVDICRGPHHFLLPCFISNITSIQSTCTPVQLWGSVRKVLAKILSRRQWLAKQLGLYPLAHRPTPRAWDAPNARGCRHPTGYSSNLKFQV
jgi:hypothetical protein